MKEYIQSKGPQKSLDIRFPTKHIHGSIILPKPDTGLDSSHVSLSHRKARSWSLPAASFQMRAHSTQNSSSAMQKVWVRWDQGLNFLPSVALAARFNPRVGSLHGIAIAKRIVLILGLASSLALAIALHLLGTPVLRRRPTRHHHLARHRPWRLLRLFQGQSSHRYLLPLLLLLFLLLCRSLRALLALSGQ